MQVCFALNLNSPGLLQAISLDFLGVPGSEVASKTADLIEKHGFPKDKRLGAGVVDGRSVWAEGETPSALVAALQAKVNFSILVYIFLGMGTKPTQRNKQAHSGLLHLQDSCMSSVSFRRWISSLPQPH